MAEGSPRDGDLAERVERGLAAHRAAGPVALASFALFALAGAIVAARPGWGAGPWLWNLDLPKVDYPLAAFFHDALAAGRLPLWVETLGLGYPLYAEGQVGAFYPPNWLAYLLPPLVALDLVRILHLVLAGVGAGLLGLRLTGSRLAAVIPVAVAVLGGAIAAKLEWHNLVIAYGWLPWVLLPLVRPGGVRSVPSRRAALAAGTAWGIQALAAHPNTWLLTGFAAAILAIAGAPRLATVGRLAATGLVGIAIGAVQLVPTAILTTLSVRESALGPSDLFGAAATPFDPLGLAFANAFAPGAAGGEWDRYAAWYPDGTFALLEAAAYVGLPVLALAAIGAATRVRARRPLLLAIGGLVAIPVAAAFQPTVWSSIPLLNVLRSPVRAYVVVTLLLGLLAALGAARLGVTAGAEGRDAGGRPLPAPHREPAALAIAASIAFLAATILIAAYVPAVFDALYRFASSFLDPAEAPDRRARALSTLSAPLPLLAELAIGLVALALTRLGRRGDLGRRSARLALTVTAVAPLALFGHAANGTADATAFSTAQSPFVQTLAGARAHRLLTLGEPGWYDGMPNQLAAAGIPDLRMFSSLDLAASDALLDAVRADGATDLRRAVGIDLLVAFGGRGCPGDPVATIPGDDAVVCRDPSALRPPWWVPADRVLDPTGSSGLPWVPRDREVRVEGIGGVAVPATTRGSGPGTFELVVDAPADGWVWIDRAWWPTWDLRVDGEPVRADRALAGLLVPVSGGPHEIRASLVPWDALGGLAFGIVGLLVALRWAGLLRRRGPRAPADMHADRAEPLPARLSSRGMGDRRSSRDRTAKRPEVDPRGHGSGASDQASADGASAWARAHPDLAGFVGFGVFATLVYLFTSSPEPSHFDYAVRLADAFLHGRIWLTEAPSWLNELVPRDGVYYVVYPPAPALLLVPFVAVLGPEMPQQIGSALFGGIAVGLAWVLFRRLRVPLPTAALLTATFGFGTVLWWAAETGSVWLLGHVVAVMFLVASLLLAFDRRLPFLAGCLLGAAMLSRLPVVLAAPLPIALYAGLAWPPRMTRGDAIVAVRRILPFAGGLAVFVAAYGGYNLARWGTLTDQGYALIPGILQDPIYAKHGIFALEYLPRHLHAIFLRSWNYVDDPPFLQPSWWGLGVFLTTPLLLWLVRARVREAPVAWTLAATALTLVPIVTHGNVGIAQFGYRFSLDVQPLLFVALASAVRDGAGRWASAAAVLSIATCAYAVWAIGIGFVAY